MQMQTQLMACYGCVKMQAELMAQLGAVHIAPHQGITAYMPQVRSAWPPLSLCAQGCRAAARGGLPLRAPQEQSRMHT